jgi:hypothetical protein
LAQTWVCPCATSFALIHRGRQALLWGRQVSISTSSLLFTGHFDKAWLLIEAKSRTANAAGSMLGSLDVGLLKYKASLAEPEEQGVLN